MNTTPLVRALPQSNSRIAAFLFDRDGTIIVDVPYNGDPEAVRPMETAAETLSELRALGYPLGVVTNQSGIARGLVTSDQVQKVNARVEELLGPIDVWCICPHGPADGCGCRKPLPGLVYAASEHLGIPPERLAVIGDIGADVEAARAAGAYAALVPTARTRREECADAPILARTVAEAVTRLLALEEEGPR